MNYDDGTWSIEGVKTGYGLTFLQMSNGCRGGSTYSKIFATEETQEVERMRLLAKAVSWSP